jgi:predicted alpha/beta-fold hydrolase
MLDDRMLLDRPPESEIVISSRHSMTEAARSSAPSARFPVVAWDSFRASSLVRGGHLQTILGSYLPHGLKEAPFTPHLAPTTHGDQLVLFDSCPEGWKTGDRVVLLAHGLGGCAKSTYVCRMATRLYERGIRAVRLNLRGAGAGFAHARQVGHAGRSEDIAAALQYVVEQTPESPIAIVGYSMGGNLLLKHFGELGEPHPQVDRVLSVAPPIDLITCMKNMLFREGRVYDRAFSVTLRKLAERREKELPGAPHRPLPKHVKKLFDFDDHYTAPLSGFKDALTYYQFASSKPWIEKIRVPTTIVAADDDPLIPHQMFEEVGNRAFVEIHMTRSGGHLGYVGAKSADADRRWLDWRILEWVNWSAQ